jgi:hypothetical protein
MQHRFRPAARACSGAVVLAFLSACGGGGGGGSSSPVSPATGAPVTSTPAPGTLSVPGQQSSGGGAGGFANSGVDSTYAVTSNPAGQSFSVGGQSYTTPANVTPSVSSNPLAILFASGYSVPIAQVKDGMHTVYYNASSDSPGSVALISLQSIGRHAASATRRLTGLLKHGVAPRSSFNDVETTRVAVRLSAAALQKSGRTPDDVERAVGSVGQETLSATADRLRVVSVPAGIDVASFTRKIQAQPEVAEVTPLHRRRLLAKAATAVSDPAFNTPGDQWYSFATGANYAWSYNPGTGVKIAVIDTGIDETNADLTSQLAYQEAAITPIDNTSASSNCQGGAGAVPVVSITDASMQDDNGHGTNVSGLALAKSDSVGFAGTAWGAQLMAFRIFPPQNQYCNESRANIGADTADEARAITDAIAHGADVISLSIGSPSYDAVEFNAIEKAILSGVTVVAAAGNSDQGEVAGTLDYPAALPGVISVGASALRDEYYGVSQNNNGTYAGATEVVAAYSQFAPSLSVVAPGGDPTCTGASCSDNDYLHWILGYYTSTVYPTSDSSLQCSTQTPATSCWTAIAGTSQATPQVAATAAMLIAEAGGHGKLAPAQVKYIIESTADNINDAKQGHGRLNAYRALASLVHDTSAYTGPIAQKTGTAQLVAFAYSAGRTNKPKILDASFPAGVPVNTDGTFRIADVPAGTGAFHVAVWYDANADGVIDAGDQVGVNASACVSTTACTIGSISLHLVAAGYYLP